MYSKFNWSRESCRASIHCRWRLSAKSFTKWAGKRNQSRLAWRGAAPAERRPKSLVQWDSMTSRSRGGMHGFSRTTDAATGLWDSAEHRKRGPPPRQCNWVWKGRGRSVTGVSPRVVAKSKSVYPRSEASLRDGGGGEVEREEAAASANVTGLHSDVGVQRLHQRARLAPTCTHVHTRAHTLILGVRRPLPARETVTDLRAVRPHPTPRLATASRCAAPCRATPRHTAPHRAADEHLRRRWRNDAALAFYGRRDARYKARDGERNTAASASQAFLGEAISFEENYPPVADFIKGTNSIAPSAISSYFIFAPSNKISELMP